MTQQTPTLRYGILKAFNAGAYTATVQFTGSLLLYVDGIPVARDIAGAEMTAGRKVAVAFFDPNNHADACLFAIWT